MSKYFIILIFTMLFLLSACAPGTSRYKDEDDKANFLDGIWHGWIAPVTLIWQIGDRNIRIYEPNNTGIGYDLGFYIAIIGGFGGFALSRKRKKCKD